MRLAFSPKLKRSQGILPRMAAASAVLPSRTGGNRFLRGKKVLPIIPGMVAEMDILSGKRSVLNHLLRPLIKARLY